MRFELFVCFLLFIVALLLRVVFWDRFPPGFTADEAVMGYDAYSLLQSGKDQFGTPWPLAFRAFGDYRPPLAIWSTIPAIAVFGLTPFSVRLPSMIVGSLVVVLSYATGRALISAKAGLFSAFLLMLSPWSLLHTRFAQEANFATVTITAAMAAVAFWLREKKRKQIYMVCAALFFSLSFYAYHNARLTVPLLIVGSLLYFRKDLIKARNQVLVGCRIFVLVLFPLLLWISRFPEAAVRRASGQSVFSDQGIKISLYNDITSLGPNAPILWTRLSHNKPLYYGKAILSGYLSHFSPNFLFFTGDPHERFRTPLSGLLNWVLIIFLPVGAVIYLRGQRYRKLVILWLLLSPVVASLSTIVPNSQHAQDMMVPLHLLAGAGAASIFSGKSALLKIALCVLFVIAFVRFLIGYIKIIPFDTTYLQAWHYYGNLFEKLQSFSPNRVVFLGGQYYINLAFFLRYDPLRFQREVRIIRPENLVEFDHVEAFGPFEFKRNRDIPAPQANTIYVRLGETNELIDPRYVVIDREVWPDGVWEYRVMKRLE